MIRLRALKNASNLIDIFQNVIEIINVDPTGVLRVVSAKSGY